MNNDVDKLNRGRVLRLSRPVLEPMLAHMERVLHSQLLGIYRAGRTDFLSTVAELNVIAKLKHEIKKHENETNQLEEKFYGRTDPAE